MLERFEVNWLVLQLSDVKQTHQSEYDRSKISNASEKRARFSFRVEICRLICRIVHCNGYLFELEISRVAGIDLSSF